MDKIGTLFEFAFFKDYADSLENLSELADKENWDAGKKHSVLHYYLHNTYSKLVNEGKISFTKNNTYACFNTGLLTRYDEVIYATFEKNKRDNAKTSWFFKSFCKESTPYLYQYCDNKLPEKADYFDNPSKLIYNPKKQLVVNYEHIINDNRENFQASCRKKAMKS